MSKEDIKLITKTKKGTKIRIPVTLDRNHGYIHLIGLPFGMKDEIKACLSRPYWDNDRRAWRVIDDERTRFQLEILQGGNPYEPWDCDLVPQEFDRDLYDHQELMTNWQLTYRRVIIAAEMGLGKTLSLIEGMERADALLNMSVDWWYVAPKSGLEAIELEFEKWGFANPVECMTYDAVLKNMKEWNPGDHVPRGLILDEFSRCKNARAQRSQACKFIADEMRARFAWECLLWGASGSPAAKSPVDWWMLCEIIQPGFLRENDYKTLEWRLGIHEAQNIDGTKFNKRVSWRDDPRKCDKCGRYEYEQELDEDGEWTGEFLDTKTHEDSLGMPKYDHTWVESINEVALLSNRMQGLVLPLFKKDCLDLPELEYELVDMEPTASVKRAARAIAQSATSTIQALTWLRALSDGFQYNIKETDELIDCKVCQGTGEYKHWEVEGDDDIECWADYAKTPSVCEYCGGTGQVPKSIREAKYYKGPKEAELIKRLDQCDEHGRNVVAAGFQASVDLCMKVCHRKGWDVIRIDGRGWRIFKQDGSRVKRGTRPLRYWKQAENKTAIVMHAESGGMGLTLIEAFMIVIFSNDFKPENRIQLVNRIHRPGMTRGGIIVDMCHLGTDKKVLNVLNDNRRIEKMSLGELREALE
jgi:SNF2 family DNA or RNA helicase